MAVPGSGGGGGADHRSYDFSSSAKCAFRAALIIGHISRFRMRIGGTLSSGGASCCRTVIFIFFVAPNCADNCREFATGHFHSRRFVKGGICAKNERIADRRTPALNVKKYIIRYNVNQLHCYSWTRQ